MQKKTFAKTQNAEINISVIISLRALIENVNLRLLSANRRNSCG